MGAVDQADYYCASYLFSRKTLRWWRKLFYWMLEVSVVNYFILYKQETQQSAAMQLQYRKKLIMQLVGNIRNANSKNRGRQSSENDQERFQKIPHFMANSGRGRTKLCMVCNTKEVRKTTVYHCETCSRKPGLHLGKCFKDYHTKLHYK